MLVVVIVGLWVFRAGLVALFVLFLILHVGLLAFRAGLLAGLLAGVAIVLGLGLGIVWASLKPGPSSHHICKERLVSPAALWLSVDVDCWLRCLRRSRLFFGR
uniref:NfeD domain-containing protein n=1 Tax=Steinernema glaseri TaxID=37863 RepID=A0A1I7ZQ52_9BILA